MKRASLSLSVNAIVVFILAFAMLGVGLFFVNKVRSSIDIDPASFLPANQLKNPPSSDDPLTIDNEVKIKNKGDSKLTIGFYNKNADLTGVKFLVTECTSSDGSHKVFQTLPAGTITCTGEQCPAAESPGYGKIPTINPGFSGTIVQGEGKGFPQILNAQESLLTGTNYVCTFAATDNANTVIETKSFYLTVLP